MKAPRPLQSPSAQMPGTLVAQLVVDRRCSRARRSATPALSRPRSSVFGRRPTASSTCEPTISGSPVGAVDADRDAVGMRREADAFGVECGPRCLRASRISRIAAETSSSSRPISRGPISTTVTSRAEAAEHLREFEPDIAAADDHQVPRHAVELQHRACWSDTATSIDAGHVGHERAAADIDEDARRRSAARRRPAPSCGDSNRAWP